MKVNTLKLRNIRSYEDEEIDFSEGTTLIHGDNGAGKSTLLLGIFGGFFQGSVTSESGNSFQLGDVVRRGEDEGEIVLEFEVGGQKYTVEWSVTVGDKSSAEGYRGKTKDCVLRSPALEEPISGVRDVSEYIQDLLGMDNESFSNSVYVGQGEVDKLINADSSTRQEMIDSLLGFDELDRYIENMEKARPAAKAIEDGAKNRLTEVREQAEEYDEETLKERERELTEKIESKKGEITDLDNKIDDLEDARDKTNKKLDEYGNLKDEKVEKERKLKKRQDKKEDINSDIDKGNGKISDARGRIKELEDKIQQLDDEVEELDLTTQEDAEEAEDQIQDDYTSAETERATAEKEWENAERQLEDAEKELDSTSNQKERLEEEVEELKDELKEHRSKLDDILSEAQDLGDEFDITVTRENLDAVRDNEIPDVRSELNEEKNSVENTIAGLEAQKEQMEKRIAEFDDVDEEGVCPLCEQDVEPGHFEEKREEKDQELEEKEREIEKKEEDVGKLDSRIDSLNDLRDTVLNAIQHVEENIEETDDEIQDKEEAIDELEDKLDDLQDEVDEQEDEIEDLEAEFEEAKKTVEELEDQKSTIESAVEAHDKIDDERNTIEKEQQNIKNAKGRLEDINQRINELNQGIKQLDEKIEGVDVDELEKKLEKAKNGINQLKNKKSKQEKKLDELKGYRRDVRNDLDQLDKLRKRMTRLQEEQEWGNNLYKELQEIRRTYIEVKNQLRQENLQYINHYTNEIFEDLYQSTGYEKVRIDEGYQILMEQKDGTTVAPNVLSGGERAILNLALRAGIYRLIAERTQSGERLPPFILDEPTTFLDDSHVGQLEEMLQTIKTWEVPQVLVVSHDEALIDSADNACYVEKDSAENVSHVEMRTMGMS